MNLNHCKDQWNIYHIKWMTFVTLKVRFFPFKIHSLIFNQNLLEFVGLCVCVFKCQGGMIFFGCMAVESWVVQKKSLENRDFSLHTYSQSLPFISFWFSTLIQL